MLNLILFGPPGSGKGTQAQYLKEKYGLIHVSTGDLLREEIAGKTTLGMEAQAYMDKGELVPDAVVVGMIKSKLETNKNVGGIIFDGFPRTVKQAEALDELLAEFKAPIKSVVSIKVDEEELKRRLLERGKVSGRPDDQDESIIQNRIREYRDKTAPVATYYQGKDKLAEVNGVGGIEDIFASICEKVEAA
jgi:adenylate kinase